MRALVMSCVCAGGAGVWAMAGGGHDATATVNKPPQAVYAAVSSAFTDLEASDAIPGKDGETVAFQIAVDRKPGESVQSTVLVGGEKAATIEFTFAPAADGAATKMTGDIDVNQAVLHKNFDDGPNGDIARIPSFAFDIAMKAALADMAKKIEAGMPLDTPRESFAELRHQQQMESASAGGEDARYAEEARRVAEEQRMEQASAPVSSAKPMMDLSGR